MVSGKSTGSAIAGERIIDLHGKGIGDVVVACWLLHSARQAGESLQINPRGRKDVCRLFALEPDEITERETANWAMAWAIAGSTPRSKTASRCPDSGPGPKPWAWMISCR